MLGGSLGGIITTSTQHSNEKETIYNNIIQRNPDCIDDKLANLERLIPPPTYIYVKEKNSVSFDSLSLCIMSQD